LSVRKKSAILNGLIVAKSIFEIATQSLRRIVILLKFETAAAAAAATTTTTITLHMTTLVF
jgi:hypothetical protein